VLRRSNETIPILNIQLEIDNCIELPLTQTTIFDATTVYDPKYGLICIGGYNYNTTFYQM